MKTEKTQLTTKVSSLEQIVLQLLTYQTQRMNIDNFKTNQSTASAQVQNNMHAQRQPLGSQFNMSLAALNPGAQSSTGTAQFRKDVNSLDKSQAANANFQTQFQNLFDGSANSAVAQNTGMSQQVNDL